MAGLLKGLSHHALMLGTGAGAVVGQNFSVRRHEAAQGLRIFIIHGGNFVGTKVALFFYRRLVVVNWSHRIALIISAGLRIIRILLLAPR